jgi:hypothetical protein
MSVSSQSERQGVSIVALGSFNPAIFHPDWFARHGLIRDAEAADANASEVKVVSPEVTLLKSEWFTLQATTDRFSIETRDPRKYLPLKDLVTATFGILEHTPVRAFGFNNNQQFQFASDEAWHHFGHHFAPKQSWQEILDQPGMSVLTIQGTRNPSNAERIQISIQPASGMPNSIVISINEHYGVNIPDEDDPTESTSVLIDKLEQSWDAFLDFSNKSSEHLLKEGQLPS